MTLRITKSLLRSNWFVVRDEAGYTLNTFQGEKSAIAYCKRLGLPWGFTHNALDTILKERGLI